MKTSYSRHELYALGEPLGDSATRREGNRVIYGGGGSGGGSSRPTETTSNVTQTNLPGYVQPYVENMLGATQNQLFQMSGEGNITGFQPYKAYGGTYDAAGNQTSYDPGKGIAGFQPLQQKAQTGVQDMKLPDQYRQAMDFTGTGIGGGLDVVGQSNVGGFQNQVGGYMSPYMQNVVDIQKREAGRQSAIQGTQQQAQATSAGGLGGGRDAIMRAERERNLGQQMNDIQAQGSQAAFQGAQQQYNQNLQNQLAGYGQAMQGANQLASLGGQQLQAQQGIYNLQNQYGGQQQTLEQQKLNQAQQDYANAQQYPMMQLGSMSNMLRGLPMQATTTQQYQAQPNLITQGIGAAGALGSLYGAYKAEGGVIKGMASGGITSIPRYDVGGQVMSQLEQMDDRALENEAKTSPSPRIREMAQAILKQRQAGMDTAPQMDMAPPPQQGMGMAGGGIIAFADGKKVPKPNYSEDVTGSILAENADIDAMVRANAQRRAALSIDDRSARDPSLYRSEVPPSPYAENEKLPLGQRITNTLDRIRSRTDPAFVARSAAAPSDTAAVLNENESTPAGITAAAPKAANLSSRAAEFAAARNFKAPTKTGGKYISEAEYNANRPAATPQGSPTPVAEPVAPFKEMSADALKAYENAAAGGNTEAANALQAYYKQFPKAAAPASGIKQISAADFDAARKLTGESASIMAAAPTADKAAITAAQVDPFASTRDALAKANAEAGKTKKELYDEDLEAKKALGLDQNEAQQAYMKRIMEQQSNIAADAEQKKYLRLAEFFASWGSTPGDTLVAGMKAVKEKIPDMIADVKERRKAEAEADKILYELGQAVRQEKLGNWDKAEIKKTKLAESAAKLQETLTTAQTSYAVAGVNKTGSVDVAKINKAGTLEATKYSSDAQVRIAQLREESASIDRSASRTNADENKKFGQYQAASQQEILVNNRIANEENGKQHVADVKFISDAALIDSSDMPAGYADKIKAAKKRIETREKNWDNQLIDAKKNTELAYSRVSGITPTTTPKIVDPFAKP